MRLEYAQLLADVTVWDCSSLSI